MYQHVVTDPLPGSDRSPDGLRVLAIILSLFKAVPLAIGVVGLLFIVGLAGSFDEVGALDGFEGALFLVVAIFLVFIGIGALLLIIQVRSVLKNRMLPLAIVAGIMAGLDLLGLLGSLTGSDASAGGAILMGLVFGAQATVAGWAIKLRSSSGPVVEP